jgi:hypothetical protein
LIERAEQTLNDLDTELGVALLTMPPNSESSAPAEAFALGLSRARSKLTLACAAFPGQVWEQRLRVEKLRLFQPTQPPSPKQREAHLVVSLGAF